MGAIKVRTLLRLNMLLVKKFKRKKRNTFR